MIDYLFDVVTRQRDADLVIAEESLVRAIQQPPVEFGIQYFGLCELLAISCVHGTVLAKVKAAFAEEPPQCKTLRSKHDWRRSRNRALARALLPLQLNDQP